MFSGECFVHIRQQICKRRAQKEMQLARRAFRKICVTHDARAKVFAAVAARFATKTRRSTSKIARVWCRFGAKFALNRRAQKEMQITRRASRKFCRTRDALAQVFAAVAARFATKTRRSTSTIARDWCRFGAKIWRLICNRRAEKEI